MRHLRRRVAVLACCLLAACGSSGSLGTNQPPTAMLTADPVLAGLGEPITFTAAGSADADGYLATYRFIFADGSPAALTGSADTTHAYGAPGVYTVTLVVTDDRGAEASASATVTITDAPPPAPECGLKNQPPCPDGQTCVDGMCQCPADTPTLCDGACVDTTTNRDNCDSCGNACGDGQDCINSMCVDVDACAPLTTCSDGCVDTSSDPFNCDGCGNVCDSGVCENSTCATQPAGTVLEVFPPPPFTTTRGLTNLDGTWYMTSGRRFVAFNPTTGQSNGDWFIDNQAQRRGYGLAGVDSPMLGPVLVSGSFDRFGDPTQNVNLEIYPPFAAAVSSIANQGGPCADDGSNLYVYSNQQRALLVFDPMGGTLVQTTPVTGLAIDDWFTDMALDGHGRAWLTRPTFGNFGPLFLKVDLATGAFVQAFDPPTANGLGGIEVFAGDLWGIADDGTYRMVP